MNTSILTASAAALLCIGLIASSPSRDAVRGAACSGTSCEAIIGTGAFNVVHPVRSGTHADMQRQMTARLEYVESLLRSRDVSTLAPELRAERMRNLDRLHAYRLRGEYPTNDLYPTQLRPCFIDRDGNICAVGYLVEQSAGRPLAERINSAYQYATVNEMASPELAAWIARSGFTHAEVATIQEPGFQGRPQPVLVATPVISTIVETENTVADTSQINVSRTDAHASAVIGDAVQPSSPRQLNETALSRAMLRSAHAKQ